MTKVWLVFTVNDLIEIFSTEEAAQEYIDEYDTKYYSFHIEEWTVNE